MIDFWTAFPYWAIFAIVLINAYFVRKMRVVIDDDPAEDDQV